MHHFPDKKENIEIAKLFTGQPALLEPPHYYKCRLTKEEIRPCFQQISAVKLSPIIVIS